MPEPRPSDRRADQAAAAGAAAAGGGSVAGLSAGEVAALGAIAAVLLAGGPSVRRRILELLIRAGIDRAVAGRVLLMVRLPLPRDQVDPLGPGLRRETLAAEARFAAAYVVNAARRATEGTSMLAEERYSEQHRRAVVGRVRAAVQVQTAADSYGDLLGWRAVLDHRTSSDCRAAHGRNFHASRRPRIGYPGQVHPACRCRPGAPRPGAPVLP